MKSERNHSSDSALQNYSSHSLNNFCPPLQKYLSPGLHVLDVGCGPGTVSANIAESLDRGHLTGIDLEDKSVAEAKKLSDSLGQTNTKFLVGNAYDIPFEDNTFDLSFSSACFEYLFDPITAVKELIRVTKPGSIVSIRAGDFGTLTMFPKCPIQLDLVHIRMNESMKSEDRYFNAYFGREVFNVLSSSGLEQINVEGFVPPLSCNYPGSEYYEWRRDISRKWFDPERLRKSPAYEAGSITDEMLSRAADELENWLQHPGSFFMISSVLGVGRVPK